MLGSTWKSMNFDEKLTYFKIAEENHKQKVKELEELLGNVTLAERNALQKRLKAKKSLKIKRNKKNKIKRVQY
jgi:hypothetical protein